MESEKKKSNIANTILEKITIDRASKIISHLSLIFLLTFHFLYFYNLELFAIYKELTKKYSNKIQLLYLQYENMYLIENTVLKILIKMHKSNLI